MIYGSTTIYVLGKGGPVDSNGNSTKNDFGDTNYAMCGISVGLTAACSTRYNATNGGAALHASCEDTEPYQYIRSVPDAPSGNMTLSTDIALGLGEVGLR